MAEESKYTMRGRSLATEDIDGLLARHPRAQSKRSREWTRAPRRSDLALGDERAQRHADPAFAHPREGRVDGRSALRRELPAQRLREQLRAAAGATLTHGLVREDEQLLRDSDRGAAQQPLDRGRT